ncbi:hypothetical protein BDZ91DRAFT_714740, partial [Kalaharituber pfeilii]
MLDKSISGTCATSATQQPLPQALPLPLSSTPTPPPPRLHSLSHHHLSYRTFYYLLVYQLHLQCKLSDIPTSIFLTIQTTPPSPHSLCPPIY